MSNPPQKNKQPEDIFAEQEQKNSPPAKSSRGNNRLVKQPKPSVIQTPPALEPLHSVLSQKRKLYIALIILVVIVVIAGGVFVVRGGLFSQKNSATTNAANNNNISTKTTNQKVSVPTVSTNAAPDADGDGLTDAEEKKLGTNQNNKDSDNDGLFDREEVKVYKTNPTKNDTDGDGISDGDEVKKGTNPNGSGQLLDLNTARQQTSNTNQ